MVSTPPRKAGTWRDRTGLLLRAIRANPTGRLALRVVIGVLGGVVVLVGLTLIPLPGPGWLIVLLGLGIWAIEFVWARHLLAFTRNKIKAWTAWVGHQSWPVRLAVGAAGLLFVGAVAYLTLRYSFGGDFLSRAWALLTSG